MTSDAGDIRPRHIRAFEDIPSDGSLDATLPLLRQGYGFISRRCDRLGTDVFRTHLMMRSAICFRGPRWTRLFYGAEGLTRVGAMPAPVLKLLQDKGSVQQLEGTAHRHRKSLFTGMFLDAALVDDLVARFREIWLRRLPDWQERREVCLLTAVSRILAEAAFDWGGLPLDRKERDQVSGATFRMVDQAGRPRIATLAAMGERRRTERRLRDLVAAAREGQVEPDSPLARIAGFRDADGALLPLDVAAVELLNVIRPIVAVGRYITFLALTLHEDRDWRDRLRAGNGNLLEPFCEEVRRRAPFFALTAAITREPLEWEGLSLPADQWLIFDIHGTLHEPQCFPDPDVLRPERLLSWRDGEDCFVPQGGGEVHRSHRCPGEMATVSLMAEAARILCREMRYEVPEQDLRVDPSRIPAQPASGFIINGVQAGV